jgi:phosphoserine/homoserine phosphotransferase
MALSTANGRLGAADAASRARAAAPAVLPSEIDSTQTILATCQSRSPAGSLSVHVKQSIVTLDMEGVLTPEIWIAVAERTGIPALRRTTRDEPDYDKLMRYRIDLMDQHGITLSKIQEVIGGLSLLPGALNFLNRLRERTQVIILSDTFEQFAQPLMRQLGWPTLLCHRLVVENDRITGYQLRLPEQKKAAVAALQTLNYRVIAAGDSFNDTAMLSQADVGILFHAPENIVQQFPQFPSLHDYDALLKLIEQKL